MAHRLPPAGIVPPPPEEFFAFQRVFKRSELFGPTPNPQPVTTKAVSICHLKPKLVAMKEGHSHNCHCCCCMCKDGKEGKGSESPQPVPCSVKHKHYSCGLCVNPPTTKHSKSQTYHHGSCHNNRFKDDPKCPCGKK